MKKLLSVSLTILLLQNAFCFILLPNTISAQTTTSETTQKPTEPLAFGLQDGTPVKLRLSRNMSSADAKTGETVDFEVLEDVKIGETVIIPRGGVALATVTMAKPRGRLGKGGKLDINIDSVRLVSGEKIALRAVKANKGDSKTGSMTAGLVVTGILFFPAAPLFLFMKGKDISIPKGTEVTAYVNGNTALDAKKFAPLPDGQTTANAADFSSVSVKSAPEGAEILVNGKFVGSTPSTLQLKFGEHKISVKKADYVLWERTLTLVAGDNITIDAALEKIP